MKNKIIVFLLFIFVAFSSYSEDSYLNLDKLRKITRKKEVVKKADSHAEEMKHPLPIMNPIHADTQIKREKKNEKPVFVKPEFLGMIMNHNYKAVLLKYKEQYLYLREGESDVQSKIKIIKIKKDRLVLEIDKKRVDIEVDDE